MFTTQPPSAQAPRAAEFPCHVVHERSAAISGHSISVRYHSAKVSFDDKRLLAPCPHTTPAPQVRLISYIQVE